MSDPDLSFHVPLAKLDQNAWLGVIDDAYEDHGFFEQLGQNHAAGFIEGRNQLLVTFEVVDRIREDNIDAEPRGLQFVRDESWSILSIFAFSDTWFRDKSVYDFFDRHLWCRCMWLCSGCI